MTRIGGKGKKTPSVLAAIVGSLARVKSVYVSCVSARRSAERSAEGTAECAAKRVAERATTMVGNAKNAVVDTDGVRWYPLLSLPAP